MRDNEHIMAWCTLPVMSTRRSLDTVAYTNLIHDSAAILIPVSWHILAENEQQGSTQKTRLIQCVDARAEPPMNAKYLVIDDGRQAKVVEDVGAIPPHVHRPVL